MEQYLFSAILAFCFSWCGIQLSLKFFPRFGIMDRREAHSMHQIPAVRGGGLAIFFGFFFAMLAFADFDAKLIAVMLAASGVVILNFCDDIWNISRFLRLVCEFILAFFVIYAGVGIENITSPFGGILPLDIWKFSFLAHEWLVLADLLALFWIVGMMNIFNWIDGVDGLAGGIGAISALVLFALSLLPLVSQPEMALLAITLFGAIMGFLPNNFLRGDIKMGDSGAKFLGFLLAVTAILNQGKIATFFLILGLPIFDFVWVIGRRIFIDRKSPFHGDQGHFHHRLLRAGFSKKQTVIFMWSLSAIFGAMALFLSNSLLKLYGIILLFTLLLLVSFYITKKEKSEE